MTPPLPGRALALACCTLVPPLFAQVAVLPSVETAPVPSSGDAADDSVVWVHPVDRAKSTVIGTDKESGLAVYDLAGTQLQFLPDGNLNNVDLRYGFPLGGKRVAVVTSGERGANVLAIYVVDPDTRLLRNVAARAIPLGPDTYGCCMYQSPLTGETYFFCTSEDGAIQQWRLFDAGAGRVDAALVRSFAVSDQAEGCVADDEARYFFVSEEDTGVWRFGAEPGDTSPPVLVDGTGPGGHLKSDVEGLSIYYARDGAGYLLVSSQGSSTFEVYDRKPPHAHRLSFSIAAQVVGGIDAVTGTDGIDVMNLGLGASFPDGVFIAQDTDNPGGNQNFKLVSWAAIANAANPPLIQSPGYDVHGTAALSAGSVYRNGTHVNPFNLVKQGKPRLGSIFACFLDCSGHAPGPAYLFAFDRRATGPTSAMGQLLVDTSSARFFFLSKPHAGNSVRFDVQIPASLQLCGFTASIQGTCAGAPGSLLSNAIDIWLGP